MWFLLAGAQKFLAREFFERMFLDFGLPLWMVPAIGIAELAGAVLVLVPRCSAYGAGLIAALMLGATGSHLMSGVGSPIPPIVALVMAALVLAGKFRSEG